MKNAWSYSVLMAAVLGMSACSSLFTKSNVPEPVEVPEFKASAELKTVFDFSVDSARTSLFEPLWVKGTAWAVGVDGKLKARSENGDTRALSFDEDLGSGVDGDDSMLVAASAKGRVLAISTDGKRLWQRETGAEVLARPRLVGDSVYVRTQDGRLLVLAAASGDIRWQAEVKNPSLVLHVPNGMAFSDSTVFAAFPGGRLRAYARADGKLVWEGWVAQPKGATELERMTDVVGNPWLDGSQVCAASYQGKIACFDAERGEIRWSRDFSSSSGLSGDHRYIYATNADSQVVAFDKTTGRQIWKQDKMYARRLTQPTVFGNWVAVADFEGKVYLLKAENGELAAINDVGDGVRSAPVLADEGLLVQDEDGDVSLLRLR